MEYRHIKYEDSDYPEKLKVHQRMPSSLYIKGELPHPNKKSIAIVGARNCSPYGKKTAYDIAKKLSQEGVQIISGLALGIDSYAHRGAVDAGGKTFAVLGCGIKSCYPISNTSLYDQIICGHGGIITEFEPDAEPLPYHFPVRNRIISALSDGVIVVEAKKKSGSLITANYALEQGIQVYAVPGRITDQLSYGTNELIAQGAIPVVSAETVLQELGLKSYTEKERIVENLSDMAPNERMLYELISSDAQTIEMLSEKSGLDMVSVSEALMLLEIKNKIAQFVPGHYVRS